MNTPAQAQTFAEPRMIVTRLTAELRRVAFPELMLRDSREPSVQRIKEEVSRNGRADDQEADRGAIPDLTIG